MTKWIITSRSEDEFRVFNHQPNYDEINSFAEDMGITDDGWVGNIELHEVSATYDPIMQKSFNMQRQAQ